jgi:hypothetical protein
MQWIREIHIVRRERNGKFDLKTQDLHNALRLVNGNTGMWRIQIVGSHRAVCGSADNQLRVFLRHCHTENVSTVMTFYGVVEGNLVYTTVQSPEFDSAIVGTRKQSFSVVTPYHCVDTPVMLDLSFGSIETTESIQRIAYLREGPRSS